MLTRPFREHRYRWVDNIKMGFKQIKFASVEWIKITWNEVQWKYLLKTVMTEIGEPYIHQLSDGQLHIKDSTFHKLGELVIIFNLKQGHIM